MGLAFPFLAAYFLDLLLGDPPQWPHPIRFLGRVIEYWEGVCYRSRVGAGVLFWLGVMGTTLIGALGLLGAVMFLPRLAGFAVLAYFLYTGLATRSLHYESRKVEEALSKGNLEDARSHLGMIVGRDTSQLGPEEIRRGVIETVAENLADGVVAPMFFILLLGLPGLFLYKAANTMDSMVGYKNYRYAKFGKMAARADDVLNFLPARLTALLMVAAAAAAGLDTRETWRILRRDAGNASSPNAGWPEAAMAGALGVRLGGPSTYFGQVVQKPFIGEPREPLAAKHHRQAIRVLYATSLMMATITFIGLLAGGAGPWGLLGLVR
ncbi:MAG: adenosylcobinamide-phosphate synthase CbiB [Syntrophales bacterium]|nr:adenosylcobinamide-phosphate synthase CbiB [Syntrophales bacterium]MDD5643323.1 adenosylcobinamide-phosphate synthase CbiB [Syntrophales bacterium]